MKFPNLPLRRPDLDFNNRSIRHFERNFYNKSNFSYSLQGTRAKVWKQRMESPLFCVKTYASDLEKLFKLIWDKYSHGEKSDHISLLMRRPAVC